MVKFSLTCFERFDGIRGITGTAASNLVFSNNTEPIVSVGLKVGKSQWQQVPHEMSITNDHESFPSRRERVIKRIVIVLNCVGQNGGPAWWSRGKIKHHRTRRCLYEPQIVRCARSYCKRKKRHKLKLIENNIRYNPCPFFGVRRVENKKVASERKIVPAIWRGRPLLHL